MFQDVLRRSGRCLQTEGQFFGQFFGQLFGQCVSFWDNLLIYLRRDEECELDQQRKQGMARIMKIMKR